MLPFFLPSPLSLSLFPLFILVIFDLLSRPLAPRDLKEDGPIGVVDHTIFLWAPFLRPRGLFGRPSGLFLRLLCFSSLRRSLRCSFGAPWEVENLSFTVGMLMISMFYPFNDCAVLQTFFFQKKHVKKTSKMNLKMAPRDLPGALFGATLRGNFGLGPPGGIPVTL